MKTLYNYILEKANFLVKKHLPKSKVIGDEVSDIVNEYFGEYETGWNGNKFSNTQWTRKTQNVIRQYYLVEMSYWLKVKENIQEELEKIADKLSYTVHTVMSDNIMLRDAKSNVVMIHVAYMNKSVRVMINRDLVNDEDIV